MQIKANKTPLQQALRKVAASGSEVVTYGTIVYYSGNCKTGNFASGSIPVTGQAAVHHSRSPSIYLS